MAKAKNLEAFGPSGFWPWNSLGTIFTKIPPRIFRILYQFNDIWVYLDLSYLKVHDKNVMY